MAGAAGVEVGALTTVAAGTRGDGRGGGGRGLFALGLLGRAVARTGDGTEGALTVDSPNARWDASSKTGCDKTGQRGGERGLLLLLLAMIDTGPVTGVEAGVRVTNGEERANGEG